MLIKGILTIKFNIILSRYPYDVQNITMNFVLWHYSEDVCILYSLPYETIPTTPIRVSQRFFKEDILWKIESTYADHGISEFIAGNFNRATFGIILKR